MAQEPSKPLSIWRIMWEGLKLPTKNIKLILPVLIVNFVISSTLYLANYYSTYPLLFDLINNLYPTPPSPRKDLKPLNGKLAILQCILTIASIILSYCSQIITANATMVTYLTPQATLKELFTRVKRTWKGPLITQVLVGILSFAYMLVILAISLFFTRIANNSLVLPLLELVIELVLLFLYIREIIVWCFAVVISVIEDGYYGMKAIVRTKELIEGRRKQCVAITLLISLPGVVIIEIINATVGSTQVSVVGGLLMVIVSLVLNWVGLAAYTVFYYDCRKSRGEDMVLSSEEDVYIDFLYPKGWMALDGYGVVGLKLGDGYAKEDIV